MILHYSDGIAVNIRKWSIAKYKDRRAGKSFRDKLGHILKL